jgi:hypothetical protein
MTCDRHGLQAPGYGQNPLTRAAHDLSHKGRGEESRLVVPTPSPWGEGWGEGSRSACAVHS